MLFVWARCMRFILATMRFAVLDLLRQLLAWLCFFSFPMFSQVKSSQLYLYSTFTNNRVDPKCFTTMHRMINKTKNKNTEVDIVKTRYI